MFAEAAIAFRALSIGKRMLIAVGVLVAIVGALTLLVRAVSARDARLKQAGRDEVQSAWNADKAARQETKAAFTAAIGSALQPQFDGLADQIGGIATKAAEVKVTLPRALAADPRYQDTRCALTSDVLQQVNGVRSMSAKP